MERDADPHEGKEWFHANISKEQAFNLLSAGLLLFLSFISFISFPTSLKNHFLSAVNQNGRYLIRESDSTPGDYVLYFYFNNNTQRFKIHRKSYNRFEMGGRSYER